MRNLLLIAVALGLGGCDWKDETPNRMSIISVGMRHGFTSKYVMQVSNLSASQGVEARVHVFNGGKSKDSPLFVIPCGSKKDIGVMEMGWSFAAGDRGYVAVESHPTRVYFAIQDGSSYGIVYSQAEYTDEELTKKDFSKALRTVK